MNFDELIERRNTHSMKWDMMSTLYGVDPRNGLPMWVADMDFRPPESVTQALQTQVTHGVHGYFGDETEHRQAIVDWMSTRHRWTPDPSSILPCTGWWRVRRWRCRRLPSLGMRVILFTPVYRCFCAGDQGEWPRSAGSAADE
ncbi:MAG: hypothetical protein R3E89_01830 [Thiolinea sp.]